MDLNEKLSFAYKEINRKMLIILIPIILDIINYYSYLSILKNNYSPPNKFFLFKFGVISAPPSINYILENFPSVFFNFNTSYGNTGLLCRITYFTFLVSILYTLIAAFVKSFYMSYLEKLPEEKPTLIALLIEGNKNWPKYFILSMLNTTVILLSFNSSEFLFLFLPLILLYYVQYSIVVDKELTFKENLSKSINVLLGNLKTSLIMAIWYGVLLSLLSFFIFPLCHRGTGGIIISIVLLSYFGTVINKAVLEVYRGIR